MSRMTTFVLVASLAGLAAAEEPAPPAKLPRFKDYLEFNDRPVGKVKAVDGDVLTMMLPEISVRQTSRRRPPNVQTKMVEHTFTMHTDALVRWSKKPDHFDSKGRSKPFTPSELKRLKSPVGAPGYLGERTDVLPGQTVELTLLVPTKKLPEELHTDDLRVKFVLIQGSSTDPKPLESKKDEKRERKDKQQ